jgi:hypothetical protein
MSTNHEHKPVKADASSGFEQSDVRVSGIVVFLAAMTIFVLATGALLYFIGKILNSRMEKADGRPGRFAQTVEVRDLGNLPASPQLQKRFGELTQQFPAPRLQNDQGDGSDDIMSLHEREDLLLNHYSWADAAHTKVRIPIERAMEILAQQGLPSVAAPQSAQQPALLTGESRPVITRPLTSGFALTGYEQEVRQREAMEAERLKETGATIRQ